MKEDALVIGRDVINTVTTEAQDNVLPPVGLQAPIN